MHQFTSRLGVCAQQKSLAAPTPLPPSAAVRWQVLHDATPTLREAPAIVQQQQTMAGASQDLGASDPLVAESIWLGAETALGLGASCCQWGSSAHLTGRCT